MIFIFKNSNRNGKFNARSRQKKSQDTIATGWVQWVQCQSVLDYKAVKHVKQSNHLNCHSVTAVFTKIYDVDISRKPSYQKSTYNYW